jgi:outer membrane protein OmpA-like peptidoglycan-associated protein
MNISHAKEPAVKKDISASHSSKSTYSAKNRPRSRLKSLTGIIGSALSSDTIAVRLSGLPPANRAPALRTLQGIHGNKSVQRMAAGIQAKLRVGLPGDCYEQEADQVADEVMRMPEPQVMRQVDPEEEEEEEIVQPKFEESPEYSIQCQIEEEEEEELLQLKHREGTTKSVTNDIESHIRTVRGGGQPLAESERAYFEPRFGYDFSRVRMHTDARAAESAQMLNARAYTVGRDVVFGAGEYAPETNAGRRLIAHELTHTMQQRYNSVPSRYAVGIFPPNKDYKREANMTVDRISAGGVIRVHNFTPSRLSVQRVCGSRAIGRQSGCIPDGGLSVFDISGSSDELYLFDPNCDDFRPNEESRLGRLATSFGPSDTVEIHGFASEEGPPDFNEHLSCARALKAESVLMRAGISPVSTVVFKHGATPGPRGEHRSVVIPLPTPAPTPVPPPMVNPPIPAGCTPNPRGTHLPPIGTAHSPPAHMLPCLFTEAYVRTSPNWCLDAQQLHRGEICYREIPGSYCSSGNQYCYTPSGCCHNSHDAVSPVDPSSPGAGSTCSNAYRCFPGHIWHDVF